MSSSGSLTTPVIVIRASPGFMGYVPYVPVLFSAPKPRRSFRRSLPILSSSTTPPYTIGVISRPSCRLAPHPAGGRLPGSWWTGRCRCACGGGAGVGLNKQLSRLRLLGTAPLCLYCTCTATPLPATPPLPSPSRPTPHRAPRYQLPPSPHLHTSPHLPTPQAAAACLPEAHQPSLPTGPDPKWRFFWRVGERPSNGQYAELNAEPVVPVSSLSHELSASPYMPT